MSLDLRIPLGLMFLIVGVMLSVYGLFTRGSEIYSVPPAWTSTSSGES